MPAKKQYRGTVHTTWAVFDAALVADTYVLPRHLSAHAELVDGTVVDVQIEVAGSRARARSVSVSTDRPNGIGWTTLSAVPTRDIVATACLDALRRADPGKRSRTTLTLRRPDKQDAEDVRRIVQGLVGYRPNLEGFEVAR